MHDTSQNPIFFYTDPYSPLDNFSAYQVEIWGRVFSTSEHAYQWRKFSGINDIIAEEIYIARSPDEARQKALQYRNKRRENWNIIKINVMEEILQAKLTQHLQIYELLKLTGTRTIIENSPTDIFWGIGSDGTGSNHLGKIWMKLRESLSTEA